MNDEMKKMFAEASKGLNLTNDEKRDIVKWYVDDMGIIPKVGQDTFTFLFRQRVRQMREARKAMRELHGDPREAAAELAGDAKE